MSLRTIDLTSEQAPPDAAGGGAKGLSKSRYLVGLRCKKLLWWTVHEPKAPELRHDGKLGAMLARGERIGVLARHEIPGGVPIDLPPYAIEERVAATARALDDGARVIYEASFLEDGIFVAVDILERRGRGFALIEVKATCDVKDKHLPDVALQLHVLRRAGLEVTRAEIMHLNRNFRYPDLSNLFVRKNVTSRLRAHLRAVPAYAGSLIGQLSGPLPEVRIGSQCRKPEECPFLKRCWGHLPKHHVSTLYGIRQKRVDQLLAKGIKTVDKVPRDFAGSEPARRQVKSVRTGKLTVEGGLRWKLEAIKPPIAFLDFETVNPAIPVWPGCTPYQVVPVQFSCHVQTAAGLRPHEWLAGGSGDPRREFARAVIEACKDAKTVLAYNARFEKTCLKQLANDVPEHEAELIGLSRRIRDLLPIVRDHVYDPDFGGSFSIKKVLRPLTGGGYDHLEIQDGGTASSELETLLFDSSGLSEPELNALRHNLLEYCKQDTLAMVRIYERLCELAGA